ncbi:MAG: hypothetical protein HY958_12400 [Bacteroidia bacterium]|nr:hypothetical protein [Bacteroidia bacterium]
MKKIVVLTAFFFCTVSLFSQSRIQDTDNLVRQIDADLEKAKFSVDKETVSEATKNDPVSWYMKAYVYKEMMKSKVHKKKYPSVGIESLNACKKVKELDVRKDLWSKVINVLFDISPLFYNDGIEVYNSATKLKPKDGKADPKAIDLYKAALHNFENFKDIITVLGDDKEISIQLLKFHKINIYSIDYFAAFCAQMTGDNAKAKTYYKNSILFEGDAETAKQHGSVLAYYYYTGLLIDEKNYSEATRVVERGLTLYPDNKELPTIAIELTKKAENAEDQIKLFEKIVLIQPDNITIYSNLATAYSKLSDKMEEKGYASSAAEYKDKAAATYKKLTTMTTDKRFVFTYNYNAALLYYKPATKLYKDNQVLNESAYSELFKKALPFFEAAHINDPNSKNVVEILVSIYQILKDADNGTRMEEKLKKIK